MADDLEDRDEQEGEGEGDEGDEGEEEQDIVIDPIVAAKLEALATMVSADLMRNAWFTGAAPARGNMMQAPPPRRGPVRKSIEHPHLEPVEAIVWNQAP
jgi:hypothetical protein